MGIVIVAKSELSTIVLKTTFWETVYVDFFPAMLKVLMTAAPLKDIGCGKVKIMSDDGVSLINVPGIWNCKTVLLIISIIEEK
jgi:hypothetical protein